MVRGKRLLVDVGPPRVGELRRLWAAGIVTTLGAQLTAVVVPLQIYESPARRPGWAADGIDTVVAAGGLPLAVLLHGTVAAALGVPTDPGPDKRRPTGPPDRDSRHKRERGATSGERDLPAS
jgi:hypothetical protein